MRLVREISNSVTTKQGDLILDRTEKYVDNFVRIFVNLSLNFHLVLLSRWRKSGNKSPTFFKNQFEFWSYLGHFLDCISSSNWMSVTLNSSDGNCPKSTIFWLPVFSPFFQTNQASALTVVENSIFWVVACTSSLRLWVHVVRQRDFKFLFLCFTGLFVTLAYLLLNHTSVVHVSIVQTRCLFYSILEYCCQTTSSFWKQNPFPFQTILLCNKA